MVGLWRVMPGADSKLVAEDRPESAACGPADGWRLRAQEWAGQHTVHADQGHTATGRGIDRSGSLDFESGAHEFEGELVLFCRFSCRFVLTLAPVAALQRLPPSL